MAKTVHFKIEPCYPIGCYSVHVVAVCIRECVYTYMHTHTCNVVFCAAVATRQGMCHMLARTKL